MELKANVVKTTKQVITEVTKEKAVIEICVDQDFLNVVNLLGGMSKGAIFRAGGTDEQAESVQKFWFAIYSNQELKAVICKPVDKGFTFIKDL